MTGCAPKPSTFLIVDHHQPGQARQYEERFPEAYYDVGPDGDLDVVLRRHQPAEGQRREPLTQIIHIHSVWRSIPGQTIAETSQVNATVTYAILSGPEGETFEGAGSVFFEQNRKRNRLKGSLGLALLKPRRSLAPGEALFAGAEVSGEFKAVRDRRRVVRTINELERLFGPRPAYENSAPGYPPPASHAASP